jgi:regulator of ribonuclease activity B
VSQAYSEHPRFAQAWAEDQEVLERMRNHGDILEIVREIDVSFRGPISNLKLLAKNCGDFGFAFQSLEEDEDDDDPCLFLVRNQAADEASIRALTMAYLQIEDAFDVVSDGWGCMQQPEKSSWLTKLFSKKN